MSSYEVSNKTPSPRHSCQLENMKKITEKEGRLARNLLSWSIPVDDKDRMKNKRSRYNKYPNNGDACNQKTTSKKYCYGRSRYETKENEKIDNENNSESSHGPKKISFRARYWGYLFDNLKRAVDEIYATCQSDSSVVECKEVLLMLDNYRHDFKALMNWIQLEEKLENTDLNDRPTSLSWEVRKSSLGRPKRNQNKKKIKSTNNKKKILPKQDEKPKFSTSNNISLQSGDKNNESPVQKQLLATSNIFKSNSMSSVATWADKVKGITNKSNVVTNNYQKTSSAPSEVSVSSLTNVQLENVNEKKTDSDAETGDGWEKVSRLNKQSRNNKRSSFESEVVVTSNKVTKSFKSRISPQTKSPVNNFKNKETKLSSYTSKRVQEPGKRIRAKTTPLPNFKLDKPETIIKAKEAKSDTVVVTSKTDEVSATQTEENNQLTLDSSLVKLEEWEADLARTLTDQHDANILVAEQRERDLMRQLREVEEETSAESDTCENAKSMTGTEDPSEEKCCDNSEEDNYNYYYQEFVKKAEKEAAEGASWFEQVEAYNKLKQVREPGSIIQMHEKLSSPSRKRTPAESKRKLEEKHRKAEVRRQEIEKARSQRIRELTEKVQEVRTWKKDLIRSKRELLQCTQFEKLSRAKEQREQKLLKIKLKAQAEDTKVNEIAFINELQEKNKRHEVLMKIDEHETRLQELEWEKTKVMEIKTAKEESVKKRLRVIEKERQDRIDELVVKRKDKEERIEQQRLEREKERLKVASEKARERELRKEALDAAQKEAVSELQKKIKQKHNESERRHQEQLEIKKERAVELSSLGRFSSTTTTPPNMSYTTTKNENSIDCLQNKREETDFTSSLNLKTPSGNDIELNEIFSCEWKKSMKKRLKKIRSRMNLRADEFSKHYENCKKTFSKPVKSKATRLVSDIDKLFVSKKAVSWNTNHITSLDRSLNEMIRLLEKHSSLTATEQNLFRMTGGFSVLMDVMKTGINSFSSSQNKKTNTFKLPEKTLTSAAQVFYLSCLGCQNNQLLVIYMNYTNYLVDLLLVLMKSVDQQLLADENVEIDNAIPILFKSITLILSSYAKANPFINKTTSKSNNKSPKNIVDVICSLENGTDEKTSSEIFYKKGLDLISYVVASGILQLLNKHLKRVQYLSNGNNENALFFLESSLHFLQVATTYVAFRKNSSPASKNTSLSSNQCDVTHLVTVLQCTDVMGTVSVLYGLLLHEGAPQRPTMLKDHPSGETVCNIEGRKLFITSAVFRMLNAAYTIKPELLQKILQSKGIALEFRHICSHLIWYCSNKLSQESNENLLHDVIICIGNYSNLNLTNQNIMNSGVQPTILQQLVNLPFKYYSDPNFTKVLFPTLVACCYNNNENLKTLENDLNRTILSTYIENELNEKNAPKPDTNKQNKDSNSKDDIRKLSQLFKKSNIEDALKYFSNIS